MLEETTPDLSHKGGVKMWTSSGYLIKVLHLHSEQPGALPGQMTTKLGWGWGIRRQALLLLLLPLGSFQQPQAGSGRQ